MNGDSLGDAEQQGQCLLGHCGVIGRRCDRHHTAQPCRGRNVHLVKTHSTPGDHSQARTAFQHLGRQLLSTGKDRIDAFQPGDRLFRRSSSCERGISGIFHFKTRPDQAVDVWTGLFVEGFGSDQCSGHGGLDRGKMQKQGPTETGWFAQGQAPVLRVQPVVCNCRQQPELRESASLSGPGDPGFR